MNCPSCKAKTYADDQNYCGQCGWMLCKIPFKEIVEIITYPQDICPHCLNQLNVGEFDVFDLNSPLCPNCNEYFASNRDQLDPRLIAIAKNWDERPVDFFKKVLGLSNKVANGLSRCDITPLFALCMGSDEFLSIKHFGETCFREFYNARYNWKPKGELENT